MLRAMMLLVMVTITGAAEREQFTLRDGRQLVGTYDEVSQTLTLESPKATIHIDPRDILARQMVPEEKQPEKQKEPQPEKAAAQAAGLIAALAESRRRSTEMRSQAAPLLEQYNKAIQAADEADAEFALSWVLKADLSPVPVPALPSDPRTSEIQQNKTLRDFNACLASLKASRDEYLKPITRDIVPERGTGKHVTVNDDRPQAITQKANERQALVKSAMAFLNSDRVLFYCETHH